MDNPPNRFIPKPRFDYRPPSLLEDYKYLAIAFVLVVIAVAIYLIRAPHDPIKIEPPPAPPVYIEPLNVPEVPHKT
jgi:hypothetical protein